MKKFYLLLILSMMSLEATVYENAEDGRVDRWVITDNTPVNAVVTNIYDVNIKSKVIQLQGASYENQYTIGGLVGSNSAWNETAKRYLSFSLNNTEGFLIDVILETTQGLRYLRYSDDDINRGVAQEYINIGLGYNASNGQWHHFKRDTVADLKLFEPSNTIIAIQGIQVRGNCRIDNIELGDKPSGKEFVVYEDAEDGQKNRWEIVDNSSADASVSNLFDSEVNSKVIKLQSSDSYANQYKLKSIISNHENLNLKWDMQTTEGFIIDVVVMTDFGERTLRFTDDAPENKGVDGDIIFHGLGYFTSNGGWHTYSRNLQQDLIEFEPTNKIVSVETFLIRANCKLDNLELFSTPSKIYEDAEDGETTGWRIYTGPSNAQITNRYDNDLKSRVIDLNGSSYANQYIIGGDLYDDEGWNDTKHTHVKWSMKNSDGYVISLIVQTKNGNRYLQYSDISFSVANRTGEDLYYGLGFASSDGKWHTYIRDIEADLKKLEADNELLSIEGMIITGSAEIDDLELFKIYHPTEHGAGFALTFDDHDIDGWFSMRNVFLEYNTKPTFFVDQFFTLTQTQIDKLKTLENDGAEIGCHTYSHKGVETDYMNNVDLIDQYVNEQIIPAYNDMHAAGFNPQSFAYPYGEHQVDYDNAVRNYFPYLRTTASDDERRLYQLDEIFHKKGKNYNILAGDGLDNSYGNELDEIKEAFIKASKNGEIITLYTHTIIDDLSNPYAISPQKLEKVIQYSKELGLKSYTFKEAYLIAK
jgi:peptidoglycan/xylan/chitin deacetylase (PgdA/CDA1 family)